MYMGWLVPWMSPASFLDHSSAYEQSGYGGSVEGSTWPQQHGFPFTMEFPGGSDSKSVCLQCGRPGFDPWVGKICWRRKWQSTPVLLPGKSHGQRSLVGYSPWSRKESDTTERLHLLMASLTTDTAEHPDFQQQKAMLCTQNGPLLREIRQPTAYAVKLYHFCQSLG